MGFAVAADAIRTTVSSYTQGSGSLTVAGIPVGTPSPSSSSPILVTVVSASTYGTYPETYCTYLCMGLSGNTLTGLTVIDGTDTAWASGDIVEMRVCAKHINDLETQVATNAANIATNTTAITTLNTEVGAIITELNSIPSGLLKGVDGVIDAATPGVDYVVPTVTSLPDLAGVGTITAGVWQGTPIANGFLANDSVTVTAGAGLSGGGAITLGGSATIALALLSPIAAQTANFSVSAGQLAPVNCSAGSVTATLPNAPADKTLIGVKLVAVSGSYTCTVAASGSDVFNISGGNTSLTLNVTNQCVFLQYYASGKIWYVIAADASTGGYAAGSGITITTSGGARTIAATGGGSGTVTSVGLTMPANFSVSGSPVTTSGTLAVTANTPNVQIFTSSGSWTMPAGATIVEVEIIPPGGGGGGGGVQASGTAAGGGSGGGSGGYTRVVFRASDLTSPVTITMGAYGLGGTGAASTGGTGGTGGGNTTCSFGSYISVAGGGVGHGGSTTGGGSANAGAGLFSGGNGAAGGAGAAGSANVNPLTGSAMGASGGSGGGGVSSGGTAYAGGNVLAMVGSVNNAAITGGTAGGGAGPSGGNGTSEPAAVGGQGGAGGGGNATGAGGQGGAGGNYGAGGGGGGAAVTGQGAGGNGGNGAPGIMIVRSY